MTNKETQTTDKEETAPSREEINGSLGENISETIYNDYFSPYLEFFSEMGDQGPVSAKQAYNEVERDVSDDTKEKYLKKVFEFQPSLATRVADLNPSTTAFLNHAIDRGDINAASDDINKTKESCEDFAEDLYDSFVDFHMDTIEQEIYDNMDASVLDKQKISRETHRGFVQRYSKKIAKELPDELKSFDQSMTKLGGEANERITIRSLEAEGLEEGNHFLDISSGSGSDGDGADLRVKTDVMDVESVNIEVKSTSIRERGSAGLSKLDDPTILFGFFEDQAELAGNVDELIDESIAVYLQPIALSEMAQWNPERHRQMTESEYTSHNNNWLFFRSNTIFAEDMRFYNEHGKLPPRDIGHEEDYL